MAMSISAVTGVTPTSGPSGLGALSSSAAQGDQNAFASALAGAIQNVQNRQDLSGELAVKAVTGELDDVHDYTIAATEAAVALELTAAVRNRLVDAFTEILRMQA